MLKHLQKYPLCPFIVIGVSGVYLAVPVKGVAYILKLAFKKFDIILVYLCRMYFICYSKVFCRQAKSIPAHWQHYVLPLQPALARQYIHSRIWPGMSHMKSVPRRIRKFYEYIKIVKSVLIARLKTTELAPFILPLFFYCFKIIFQSCFLLSWTKLMPSSTSIKTFSIYYTTYIKNKKEPFAQLFQENARFLLDFFLLF